MDFPCTGEANLISADILWDAVSYSNINITSCCSYLQPALPDFFHLQGRKCPNTHCHLILHTCFHSSLHVMPKEGYRSHISRDIKEGISNISLFLRRTLTASWMHDGCFISGWKEDTCLVDQWSDAIWQILCNAFSPKIGIQFLDKSSRVRVPGNKCEKEFLFTVPPTLLLLDNNNS